MLSLYKKYAQYLNVKFKYCEKATKFEEISHLERVFEIFVTFSKYLNFIFKTRLKVVEPKNLHLMGDKSVLAEFNLD